MMNHHNDNARSSVRLSIVVVVFSVILPSTNTTAAATTNYHSHPPQQQKRQENSWQPITTCRQEPTWNSSRSTYDSPNISGLGRVVNYFGYCAEEMDFLPRSQYWYNQPLSPSKAQHYWGEDEQDEIEEFEESDITNIMLQCIIEEEEKQQKATIIDNNKKKESSPSPRNKNMIISEPKITAQHVHSDGTVVAVEIESALTEKEAQSVQALATCQRRYFGKSHFEDRSFGEGLGGNNCTFLAPTIQMLLPGVAAQVMTVAHLAWKTVGWENHIDYNFPNPKTLGIRTSEHLRYSIGSTLGMHRDYESVYTILVSLSDPEEYKGGEFFIKHDGGGMTLTKLSKLKALVFLSDELDHGVKDVISGVRETFANELWVYSDTPLESIRPSFADWKQFLHDWEWDQDEAVWEKPVFDDEDDYNETHSSYEEQYEDDDGSSEESYEESCEAEPGMRY